MRAFLLRRQQANHRTAGICSPASSVRPAGSRCAGPAPQRSPRPTFAQNLHYGHKAALDAIAHVAAETGNLDRVEALTGPWSDALYDAAAVTNLATIAAKAGETDCAIELANRADALEPDHFGLLSHQKAVMLSSIAEVLATTGNVQEAADFVALGGGADQCHFGCLRTWFGKPLCTRILEAPI